MKQSTKSIFISTWIIFEYDIFWNQIANILIDKLHNKITVTIFVSDSFVFTINQYSASKITCNNSITINDLRRYGAIIITNKDVNQNVLNNFITGIHEKVLIVDNEKVMIGSRNLSTPYFVTEDDILREKYIIDDNFIQTRTNFIDCDIVFNDSELCRKIIKTFSDNVTVCEKNNTKFIRNLIWDRNTDDKIMSTLLNLFANAQKRIIVINCAFRINIPDNIIEIINKRNVDFSIYTNSVNIKDYAINEVYSTMKILNTLIDKIPKIKIYLTDNDKYLIHSKVCLIDDTLMVGSYNYDNCSYYINSECVIVQNKCDKNIIESVEAQVKELQTITSPLIKPVKMTIKFNIIICCAYIY